ncbi:MAG: chromosome segregation protein SMC [Planctomycetota bacterium]
MNRSTCRLKDIRELFMGTGLGPGGYSFMEQGKIDSVLASNPVERRKVFEEAAGISRFRARRHEAELKLDKVDANLLRLADIIDELERRERSLKIQAGKAQRYREYNHRAGELQAQVALHRYHRNLAVETELAAAVAEFGGRRDELTRERDERREEHEGIGVELARRNEDLAQARERGADLAARVNAARELSDFHRRRLEELEGRSEDRRGEIEKLEAELVTGAEDKERAGEEHAALVVEVERMRAALAEREVAVSALRQQALGMEKEIREVETSLRELSDRRRRVETESARLEASETRWRDELQRAEEESERVAGERTRVASALDEESGRLELAVEELQRRREEFAAAEADLERLDQDIAAESERHRARVAERSACVGRIEALEGLVRRREGLSEGVRRILEERDRRADFLPGCRGLLLDLVGVSREVADAVESALGDAAQALVVETVAEALAGARFLEDEGEGRAAFLPLELFAGDGETALPSGVTATDPMVARVLGRLLRGVRVLATDAFEAALARGEVDGLLVTPRGDLVREGRLVVFAGKQKGVGLLAARSELAELAEERARIEAAVAELVARLEELRGGRPGAIEVLKGARTAVAEADARVKALESERRDLERQGERLVEVAERLRARIENAQRERSGLGEQRQGLAAQLAELEAAIAGSETDHARGRDDRNALREELERGARTLEGQRIELASAEQRLLTLDNTRRHLDDRHERARQIIVRFREELDGFAGDREVSGGAARESENRATELAAELDQQREATAEIEKATAAVRERHETVGRAIREIERTLEGVAEEFHRADMQLAEIRVAQQGLVARVRDELEVELSALHEGYVENDEVDWSATEEELEDLRDKIRKLGNVNLAAIEDLDEVQQRLEFLTAQRDDLMHSKAQLGRVLGSIEEESTRLFSQTFDRVREMFQVTFRKLFGGGKADIRLADPENVLESGIDITARPPGKEARSIELLSGGERTLTAVALLFSIIKAHPCPCCLLDEVDAALDEDNTERFGMLLDEFINRTQFILITHSRRTMARADVLFGVTMGERGVSRPVGVRFEDVGEDGEIKRGAGRELKPRRTESAEDPEAEDPDRGGRSRGNGNGNGNGKARGGDAASGEVQGEVLVEMSEAAGPDESGGTTRRLGGAEDDVPARSGEAEA